MSGTAAALAARAASTSLGQGAILTQAQALQGVAGGVCALVPARTDDDYLAAFQDLLPTGPIWPREPDAVQTQCLRALVPAFTRLATRAGNLLCDAFPVDPVELLAEWEETLGLPDPCVGVLPTLALRQQQVATRFTAAGGQSKSYLIAFARRLGYDITITEFTPWRFGQPFGLPMLGAIWCFVWQVNAPGFTIWEFSFGSDTFGDPFAAWLNDLLICELKRVAPAQTVPIFSFGGTAALPPSGIPTPPTGGGGTPTGGGGTPTGGGTTPGVSPWTADWSSDFGAGAGTTVPVTGGGTGGTPTPAGTPSPWTADWSADFGAGAGSAPPVAPGGGPSGTPSPTQASPDGTVLNGPTGSIVDATGATWTIVATNAGNAVYRNGSQLPYTAGTLLLFYAGGTVHQEDSARNWWSWNGTAFVAVSVAPSPRSGLAWPSQPVTWAYGTPGSAPASTNMRFSASITDATQQAQVEAAIQGWSKVCGLQLQEVSDPTTADIQVGFRDFTGTGASGYPVTASSGTSLTAATVSLQDPSVAGNALAADASGALAWPSGVELGQETARDFGACLGLTLSARTDAASVMGSTLGTGNRHFDINDIAAAQAIYGLPPGSFSNVPEPAPAPPPAQPPSTVAAQLAAAVASGTSGSGTLTSGAPSTAVTPPGLLFRDEFDGPFDIYNPSTGKGTWYAGGTWMGGQDQGIVINDTYEMTPLNPATPFNVYRTANSCLIIQFLNTPSQYAAACQNQPYTSGACNTSQSFKRAYGYIEYRCQWLPSSPKLTGVSGALWLMPGDGSWPPEIDIIETVNINQGPLQGHQNALVGSSGSTSEVPSSPLYFDMSDGQFHTIAVDWQPDHLTFYKDGVQTGTAPTPSQLVGLPMYFIIEVNGGPADPSQWGGGLVSDPSQLPIDALYVDWVRWWDTKASADAAGM